MCQRNAGIGGTAGCRSNARDDLERHTLFGQGVDFLTAATEDKGIAALESHDALAFLRLVSEQPVDVFLAHGVVVALLADIDPFSIASGHVENGLCDQPVIDDDISLLHATQGPEGQEIGVARPATDQVDLAHAVARLS